MQSSVSFGALRRLGEGAFRIVWFGNIVRGTTTDGVTVIFSPSRMTPSTGEETCDLSKRTSVVLPVAYLRKFRIGDIWEGGKWTGRRDTQTRETFHLDIAENSTAVMPVGVPLNSDQVSPQYLLPFSDFQGHRDHTHTQCVRIALQDGSMLVVPCMELVRFYFGASGSFLKRLFSGAFALDHFYSNARLNQKNRTASIELAPDLPGVAAATVARIAFCSQARSAARWIVNSSIATAANGLMYYPKTTFPFFGKTDLTAYGRWIIHGKFRIFLAEQLSCCTHPFPFDTLYYSTACSLVKLGVTGKDPALSTGTVDSNHSNGLQSAIHLTDAPVSSTLQNIGLPTDDEDDLCFPDLANKKIRRVGKPKQTAGSSKPEISSKELGVGTETSSSTLRGAELAVDLDEVALDGLPPPDAAAVIEHAVRANAAAKPGYMTWLPIAGQETNARIRNEAFVRGDAIIRNDPEKRLQNIWAGVIEVRFDPIAAPVLVLIRDNITEDADDHVLLLRLEPSSIVEDIDSYSRLFATGKQSEAYTRSILEMVGSQRATDLTAILRRLSLIVPALLRKISDKPPAVTVFSEIDR